MHIKSIKEEAVGEQEEQNQKGRRKVLENGKERWWDGL